MPEALPKTGTLWRLVVVGGHTRSIGKTQLVCDIIAAFPMTEWIAGKITQYGHGVCAQNGENCDCAPEEHICALDWEARADTGTDSSRFLAAGAKRSFWLRTKQGYLAEGMPLLRKALEEVASGEWRVASKTQREEGVEERSEKDEAAGSKRITEAGRGSDFPNLNQGREWSEANSAVLSSLATRHSPLATSAEVANTAVILESNSLMQFVKPSLYFAVIDPRKEDFKPSAQIALDRAHALVLRGEAGGDAPPDPLWMRLPTKLLQEKPSVLQREGQPLPAPLEVLVHRMLDAPPTTQL